MSIALAISTRKQHHALKKAVPFIKAVERPQAHPQTTWEERIEEASESKCARYQELVEQSRGRGWRTFYEPIEVGCRGFAGRSLCKVRLGVTGAAKKRAIQSASKATEKATRCLWLKRSEIFTEIFF